MEADDYVRESLRLEQTKGEEAESAERGHDPGQSKGSG